RAVRPAARRLPADPEPAGADAGRGHLDAALLLPHRPAGRGRPRHRHDRRSGQDEQHPQGARGDRRGSRHARRQRHPARLPRHAPHGRHRGHPHLRGHRDDPVPDRRARHHGRRGVHL
ncbi:MAG: Acyl-CoA dehydrogenase, partial [uncultured Solirubrobacterales bacterium]